MSGDGDAPVVEPTEAAERRLVRQGSVYMVARVAQILAYVAVMPLVTRRLDAAAYGEVAIALIVFQVLCAIAPVGLTSVVAWSIYERATDARAKAQQLLLSTVVLSTLVVAVAYVTAPWWNSIVGGVSLDRLLPLALWMVVPFTVQACALAIFQAEGRPAAFVATTLVATVGGQVLGLVLLGTHGTPTSYLWGLLAGMAAGAVCGVMLLRPRSLRLASVEVVVAGIRHGGPAVPHQVGFLILSMADRVLVERAFGLEDAARYQVAYVVGSAGLVVLAGVNNAWAPMIYGAPAGDNWATLARTVRPLAWLVASLSSVVALLSPIALRILAPARYDLDGLADVATIVAAAGLLDLTYLACVHVLFARKRTAQLLYIMPAAAALNVVLNLVLLDRYGLAAAAWATVASYALMGGLAILASRRVALVPWPTRELVAPVILAVVTVVACLLAPDRGPAVAVRSVVGVVIVAIVILAMRRMRLGEGVA